MPDLTVDGVLVSVADGATLLQAVRARGVNVPTLCHRDGLPHHTSCMVCLVEEESADRLVPSCATEAQPGQRISTAGERVLAARRRSIELLLAEHDGDCEAPCTRACPAHADIPAAIRRIGRGDLSGALATMMERLPLCWTLALTCPAPCRLACRRKAIDSAVDICALKRIAAEAGLGGSEPFTPVARGPTGRSVAIVGAGPAGLSAAYFLAREGHRCVVVDGRPAPGGELPAPAEALEADVGVLRRLGVELRLGRAVAPGKDLDALRAGHDALVLATGTPESLAALLGQGIAVEHATGSTPLAGVFAGGNAVRQTASRLAVRAVADGRRLARSVGLFLAGAAVTAEARRFDSRRGILAASDLAALAARAARKKVLEATAGAEEAGRCLDCDCLAKGSCELRRLAEESGADAHRFAGGARRRAAPVRGEGGISLDPGKCIKCGICVRIAEAGGDRPGLAFSLRGAEARVCVPFGEDLGRALATTARRCVAACPTGALAWDRPVGG